MRVTSLTSAKKHIEKMIEIANAKGKNIFVNAAFEGPFSFISADINRYNALEIVYKDRGRKCSNTIHESELDEFLFTLSSISGTDIDGEPFKVFIK